MTTKINTYRQEPDQFPPEIAAQHIWRCDIQTGEKDYHGTGATEAEAIFNAASAYWSYDRAAQGWG